MTERCKVPFSIGKYTDEVYCDVVDMDVCQLLFGRPWQFDVDAQHSGRSNTYRLEKNGMKYTLLPLKTKVASPKKRAFLTLSQSFETEMKETKQVYALVCKRMLLNQAELQVE